MTASSYDEALRRVLVHEGGYSNHPSDPGGPTNWGITIHDARAYWKTEATAADVRSMPVEVAKDIYRSKYWDAMRCDDLPAGVDYAVFDYGVNSGIGRAVRVLQRLAGTNVDGEVGPDTIAATARTAAVKLINQICDERLAFLQGLETWGVFGKGWGRRVREVRVAALAMVDEISRDIGASPPWLATMREISGTREYSGGADNPVILAWARFIGEKYPEMRSYCAQYNHDAIAWCGSPSPIAWPRTAYARYSVNRRTNDFCGQTPGGHSEFVSTSRSSDASWSSLATAAGMWRSMRVRKATTT
jgi:lysozyme family protein